MIPAATKAAALLDLCLHTPRYVAQKHGVSLNTVKSWKRRGLHRRAVSASSAPQKKDAIGDLLMDDMLETLRTMRAQAEALSDPEILHQLSARELAMIHGTMVDTSFRLLDALREK